MKEDPHCYWCGTEVIWYPRAQHPIPGNFATIEHLESRFGRRPITDSPEPVTALACWKCNQYRGWIEDLLLHSPDKNNLKLRWLLTQVSQKMIDDIAERFPVYFDETSLPAATEHRAVSPGS